MSAKKTLIGLDFSLKPNVTLQFALDFFDHNQNQLVLIGAKSGLDDSFLTFQKLVSSKRSISIAMEQYFELDKPILANLAIQSQPKTITQCRFADIFICDRNVYSNLLKEEIVNEDGLCCPTILLPEDYSGVNSITMLYDGSSSSLYAIKQFCSMLPTICYQNDVLLLIFRGNESPLENQENNKLLVNYLQQHCPRLAVHYYSGEERENLGRILNISDSTLLVSGSFTPSDFDNLFSPVETVQIIKIY